eukprot:scaffold9851_cov214-Skeletonema_marinoi.AAC.2
MKFTPAAIASAAVAAAALPIFTSAQQNMVKMCLFYDRPSGHARSDPIISQECASSHVHTFYGPRSFHPSTSYEDLLSTPGSMNTSPFVENKSLYWHPSIYRVAPDGTHSRVDNLEFGPYYRWDRSVSPGVEPFPAGFRMIAASNDPGSCGVGVECPSACGVEDDCPNAVSMFTECCNFRNNGESCSSWEGQLFFPRQNCDFVGIALAMPTCWNGENDSPNHKSHMAYTTNGGVEGNCPSTHPRRLPQVQVFVRIPNYRGVDFNYVLSDGNQIPGVPGAWHFHTDFFNGWEEGKFQEIMNNCAPHPERQPGDYNPPCDCTPGEESLYDGGLTPNVNVPPQVCDADVKRLIIDEEIAVTNDLPLYSGSCQGAPMIPRSWTDLTPDLFSTDCNNPITTTTSTSSTTTAGTTTTTTTTSSTTTQPPPTTTSSTTTSTTTQPPPTTTTTASTTSSTTTTTQPPPTTTTTSTTSSTTTTTTQPPPTTTTTTQAPPTTTTTTTEAPPGDGDVYKAIVCGRGYGCDEGVWDDALIEELHEVRCCRDCSDGRCPRAWKQKCPDEDPDVYSRSKVKGICEEATFLDAIDICDSVGGRLCTPWEVEVGCAAGTGCGFDREMVWTCMYDGHECVEDTECCGSCVDGECDGEYELFA